MPETLADVRRILERLERHGITRVTLLVVPGRNWSPGDIDELRGLLGPRIETAGHGWTHTARHVRGVRHLMHSLTISRHSAEHLALSKNDVRALVTRCHEWFAGLDLPTPVLYVPPAWALGPLPPGEWDPLPFEQVETLTGVWFVKERRFCRMPMVGYQADTGLRELACRAWNAANVAVARVGHPLRVAIHPQDFELRLADSLGRLLAHGGRAMSYCELTGTSGTDP